MLLPVFSSIELGMPLASVKLTIERKFFRDANLSWVNEEYCSITGRRLPLNDVCRGCRSTEEEEAIVPLLCQCPSLARHRYRLFGSSFLVSLTELSSIDIKDLASYIELSGWFSSVGQSCFDLQPLR